MNNINNEKEYINDSEYKYDQPKEDINTIYYEVKSKDDINIFEGVLINLEEYLKKKILVDLLIILLVIIKLKDF